MTTSSDLSFLTRAVFTVWTFVWFLHHAWNIDRFAALRWERVKKFELKSIITLLLVMMCPLQASYDVVVTIMKYQEGFVDLPGFGIIGKPVEMWSDAHKALIQPIGYVLCANFSVQSCLLFLLQSFWNYLANNLAKTSFMGSLEFKVYIAFSVFSCAIFATLQYVFREDPLRTEIAPKLAYALVQFTTATLGVRSHQRFNKLLHKTKNAHAAQPSVVSKLQYFQDMNRYLTLALYLGSASLMVLCVDGLTSARWLISHKFTADLLITHVTFAIWTVFVMLLLIFYPSKANSTETASLKSIIISKNSLPPESPRHVTSGKWHDKLADNSTPYVIKIDDGALERNRDVPLVVDRPSRDASLPMERDVVDVRDDSTQVNSPGMPSPMSPASSATLSPTSTVGTPRSLPSPNSPQPIVTRSNTAPMSPSYAKRQSSDFLKYPSSPISRNNSFDSTLQRLSPPSQPTRPRHSPQSSLSSRTMHSPQSSQSSRTMHSSQFSQSSRTMHSSQSSQSSRTMHSSQSSQSSRTMHSPQSSQSSQYSQPPSPQGQTSPPAFSPSGIKQTVSSPRAAPPRQATAPSSPQPRQTGIRAVKAPRKNSVSVTNMDLPQVVVREPRMAALASAQQRRPSDPPRIKTQTQQSSLISSARNEVKRVAPFLDDDELENTARRSYVGSGAGSPTPQQRQQQQQQQHKQQQQQHRQQKQQRQQRSSYAEDKSEPLDPPRRNFVGSGAGLPSPRSLAQQQQQQIRRPPQQQQQQQHQSQLKTQQRPPLATRSATTLSERRLSRRLSVARTGSSPSILTLKASPLLNAPTVPASPTESASSRSSDSSSSSPTSPTALPSVAWHTQPVSPTTIKNWTKWGSQPTPQIKINGNQHPVAATSPLATAPVRVAAKQPSRSPPPIETNRRLSKVDDVEMVGVRQGMQQAPTRQGLRRSSIRESSILPESPASRSSVLTNRSSDGALNVVSARAPVNAHRRMSTMPANAFSFMYAVPESFEFPGLEFTGGETRRSSVNSARGTLDGEEGVIHAF